ncbi:site-specific integrase [Polymorphospora sp. NPDC050346]|uniref:tyrosine-type recombinase/integrase n=1 Tax=Polymorphospora sp. NPDC050346 TaxID=3155780 RepID=UPI0034102C2C
MKAARNAVTVRAAVDGFLASVDRRHKPATRRSYGRTLEHVASQLGTDRRLRKVTGEEIAEVLRALCVGTAPSTWNQRRAAISSFLAWCARNGYPAPVLPAGAGRQPERREETPIVSRPAIERLLTHGVIPLREKTLWRMLYETTARATEVLALNIEDLELDARRARVPAADGGIEHIYWATGTAQLLPGLIRGRTRGPVFLSERRPGLARRPPSADICPHTGRARLGYDRARVLLDRYTRTEATPGWDLRQLRHSAAAHLAEANVNPQAIMAKGRWRNPRAVMRYVRPRVADLDAVTRRLDMAPRPRA